MPAHHKSLVGRGEWGMLLSAFSGGHGNINDFEDARSHRPWIGSLAPADTNNFTDLTLKG
jgi:hypothetical protein